MQNISFNVLTDKWIPVINNENKRIYVSVEELLKNPVDIKDIDNICGVVTVEYGIFRFISVLLNSIYNKYVYTDNKKMEDYEPDDFEDEPNDISLAVKKKILHDKSFDAEAIDKYILEHKNDFELFGDEKVFLQVSSKEISGLSKEIKSVAVAKIHPEMKYGNNDLFYGEIEEQKVSISAFIGLLIHNAFNRASVGGCSNKNAVLATGGNPLYYLIKGRNLLETLVFSGDWTVDFKDDNGKPISAPIWERDSNIFPFASLGDVSKITWPATAFFITNAIKAVEYDDKYVYRVCDFNAATAKENSSYALVGSDVIKKAVIDKEPHVAIIKKKIKADKTDNNTETEENAALNANMPWMENQWMSIDAILDGFRYKNVKIIKNLCEAMDDSYIKEYIHDLKIQIYQAIWPCMQKKSHGQSTYTQNLSEWLLSVKYTDEIKRTISYIGYCEKDLSSRLRAACNHNSSSSLINELTAKFLSESKILLTNEIKQMSSLGIYEKFSAQEKEVINERIDEIRDETSKKIADAAIEAYSSCEYAVSDNNVFFSNLSALNKLVQGKKKKVFQLQNSNNNQTQPDKSNNKNDLQESLKTA